ncbi:M23 family metallopeptidase [Streptomyces coeruleoprunus]|uniref:M23 family metallopeptidase n=1 Tax=Streptomyces coeruleoprunus TaxID=285563 RepID=A0ABV9XA43_9ACTN
MASNRPAPEASFGSFDTLTTTTYAPYGTSGGAVGGAALDPAPQAGEWNPTEETVRPVRGRHRVVKQRSGLARSSTVLGVGVIAAVGAGGMATAQDKPRIAISLPDLPDASDLPGVGTLIADDEGDQAPAADTSGTTALNALSPAGPQGATDGTDADEGAGEALRARILQQAEEQQASAEAEARAAAEQAAAEKAAADAEAQQTAALAAEKAAEAERKKAAEAAAAKAEAERLAKLAASYALPTSSYTITSTYGQAGSMWSSGYHTGLDLAAPTGTPANAVHGGTIKSAGWSGAYGYRIVLELEDGTEVWYCHLSSMTVSAGQTVQTGETIGRVGATGNVTGPHLHLEVHTAGGDGIDPLAWLRGKGLTV